MSYTDGAETRFEKHAQFLRLKFLKYGKCSKFMYAHENNDEKWLIPVCPQFSILEVVLYWLFRLHKFMLVVKYVVTSLLKG